MSSKRLLVVDDDADTRNIVALILRHHKIAFEITSSAMDALHLLETHQYTGAIIDLTLPDMDGWTLLQAIQSNPHTRHLLCMAITANNSPDVAEQAVKSGFKAHFVKPLAATSFASEVQRILR